MIDQFGYWHQDFVGQMPEQDPMYVRMMQQRGGQNMGQQQTAPGQGQQMISPPTRHADIIQADSLEAIDRIPQNAGTAAMYMTKDDQHIVIRDMLANGEHTDIIYDRRPPEPPAPKIDPSVFVRRDELSALIAETIRGMTKGEENGTV